MICEVYQTKEERQKMRMEFHSKPRVSKYEPADLRMVLARLTVDYIIEKRREEDMHASTL